MCNLYAPNVYYLDFLKTLAMHIDALELKILSWVVILILLSIFHWTI